MGRTTKYEIAMLSIVGCLFTIDSSAIVFVDNDSNILLAANAAYADNGTRHCFANASFWLLHFVMIFSGALFSVSRYTR